PACTKPGFFEAIRRQLGVAHGVLDIFVAEIVLQGSGIVPIVGELISAGVPKHVRMDWEWHLGSLTQALDKPMEADGAHWSTTLRNEYVGACGVFAPKLA